MSCPHYQFENREGAEFCEKYGKPLVFNFPTAILDFVRQQGFAINAVMSLSNKSLKHFNPVNRPNHLKPAQLHYPTIGIKPRRNLGRAEKKTNG